MAVAESVQNVLSHYGVPGMKWGVRRNRSGSSSSSKTKTDDDDTTEKSEDYVKALAARTKPVSALSNTEMQQLITRMNLEQQLTRLESADTPKAAPPTRVQKTAKYVQDMMLDIGKTEIRRVAKAGSSIAVERKLQGKDVAFDKKFAKQIGVRIAPGGSKKKK